MFQSWKKALAWAIVLYFLVGIAFIFLGSLYLILTPIFTAFCAWMYLRKVKPTLEGGIHLGIFFIITAVLLDFLFAAPLLFYSFEEFLVLFSVYATWEVWIGIIEILLVPALLGYWLEKKK